MNWRGSQGWGADGGYGRIYNPQTLVTVTGKVVAVEYFIPKTGMSEGVHLKLRTGSETNSVHLGPAWYIENQDVKIKPHDKIVVRGSRVLFDGKPAIIAAEVKKGDEILKLRDEDGRPVWAGWRRDMPGGGSRPSR
ncbi:MAG TPA: DNA-binding protein [Verrucomicrobiae bacterium]|nr:DNA-binding protein [Verrucomicrobiae bacterium]